MLSNIELEQLADNYSVELNGIYMKDEIKSIEPKDGNYIINLQSSTEGNGSHWLVLEIANTNCFYFDGFGIIPPTEIINFCKKIKNSTLGYNTREIQNINSETCGWYCLGLLIFVKKYKIPNIFMGSKDYLKMFSNDTTLNNQILIKYFKYK